LYTADDSYPFVKGLTELFCQHVDVDRRGVVDAQTPLMIAVFYDTEQAVAKLIERGADLEAFDEDGETALHWAAGCGTESLCKVLVQIIGKYSAYESRTFRAR
jgi:ankyrin repeat protein